jgi:predicted peptidase
MGTWSLGIKHPDRFAALVPICGRGATSEAGKIARIPVWCFHGEADRVVPVQGSRDMIAAIREAGGEPKYTEYPGVEHNSWNPAYDTEELYQWMLDQKRRK